MFHKSLHIIFKWKLCWLKIIYVFHSIIHNFFFIHLIYIVQCNVDWYSVRIHKKNESLIEYNIESNFLQNVFLLLVVRSNLIFFIIFFCIICNRYVVNQKFLQIIVINVIEPWEIVTALKKTMIMIWIFLLQMQIIDK